MADRDLSKAAAGRGAGEGGGGTAYEIEGMSIENNHYLCINLRVGYHLVKCHESQIR